MQRSTTSFSSLRASTLRVEVVETFVVDLPIIRPHLLSVATMQAQTLMIVKIVCSDGITGFGEGTTIGGLSYGAESPEGMKLAIDQYIAPILKSANPARVPETMIAIRKAIKGNNFAKCAVETALLDAWGKRIGLPMSELVGGRLRDRLPVAWTLASGDTKLDIAEAEQMFERKRHNAFKLKIGRRSIDEDVAHVAAIKRALGSRASVRVDVNMAWSEVEANKGLAGLEAAGCDLAEQPVESPTALARLAARFAIPIMADESLAGTGNGLRTCAHERGGCLRSQDRPIRRSLPGGQSRRDRRRGEYRALRRNHARRRYRHDRQRPPLFNLPETGVGHRAVRPASAHRTAADRTAAIPGFRAGGADRTQASALNSMTIGCAFFSVMPNGAASAPRQRRREASDAVPCQHGRSHPARRRS